MSRSSTINAREGSRLSSARYSPSYIDVLEEADDSDAPVADDRSALPDALVVLLDVVHTPEHELVPRITYQYHARHSELPVLIFARVTFSVVRIGSPTNCGLSRRSWRGVSEGRRVVRSRKPRWQPRAPALSNPTNPPGVPVRENICAPEKVLELFPPVDGPTW